MEKWLKSHIYILQLDHSNIKTIFELCTAYLIFEFGEKSYLLIQYTWVDNFPLENLNYYYKDDEADDF